MVDVAALTHPDLEFFAISSVEGLQAPEIAGRYDAVAVNVRLDGALELLAALVAIPESPPVVAMAGHAPRDESPLGRPMAELLDIAARKGATETLAKPVDALEVAAAAVRGLNARRPSALLGALASEIESRLKY